MALTWSYFTADLDGSRPITKAERDELYSNLTTLLGTTGCSGFGYSLNGTDQTAIRDSNLITDRASLDGPASSHTHGRFETIVSTASSAFSNYSTAVSTALTGAGITSAQRDTIITANVDDHRLWNYYRRLLDALTCVCNVPVVSSSTTAPGNACGAFSYYITGTNSPTSFSATGLPSWASLNSSTGRITGTPSASGSWSITVKATNACGDSTGVGVTISIADPCSFVHDNRFYGQCDDSTSEYQVHKSTSVYLMCDTGEIDVSTEFPCETNMQMRFNFASSTAVEEGFGFSFEVYADGVLVYTSFCCTNSEDIGGSAPDHFYAENFAVPANTDTLQIKIYGGCQSATPDASPSKTIWWAFNCEYPAA